MGDFSGELSPEAVSIAGVWLYDVTFNWKYGNKWITLGGKRVQGTYRGKPSNFMSSNFAKNISQLLGIMKWTVSK